MSTSIRKTRARILTFSHSSDAITAMAVTVFGSGVTARIMTAEDGGSSRRVKVNTSSTSTVGLGQAIVKVSCAGLNHDEVIDIANPPPPPPASFALVEVSEEVDPD